MTPPLPRPAGNRIDAPWTDPLPLAGFGPHPVGVIRREFLHPDQPGPDGRRADRRLVTEIWYPARPGTPQGGRYDTILRDGVTPITLHGRAARGAEAAEGPFPLVILSHGYPGNRFLLSHLGETLASRGHVVASADHALSTYDDKGAFGATLYHRPRDQAFLIHALCRLERPAVAPAAVIVGYSMGAYGALVAAGAALSPVALDQVTDGWRDLVASHAEGSLAGPDPRLRGVVPIGLWGAQRELWSAAGLAGPRLPVLMIGGSADTVSGYGDGIRRAFLGLAGSPRRLVTFLGAGHNAAAPIPAPEESWTASSTLDFLPAEHYADPAWDSRAMNALAQHLVAAFLAETLGESLPAPWLDPALPGVPPDLATRLRLERLPPGAPGQS